MWAENKGHSEDNARLVAEKGNSKEGKNGDFF